MKFVEANVEWWPQKSVAQQIARVGRICYKSEPMEPPMDMPEEQRQRFIEDRDDKRCRGFWESGHRSMYRHGTVYFYIKSSQKLPYWIWNFFTASPYIDYVTKDKQVWISTNMHFFCDHLKIVKLLEPYEVEEEQFIEKAVEQKCDKALMLLRMTLVVTTQISTSRELNRTSPNSISEQSTRYVNLGKKGGVQICKPHWFSLPDALSCPDASGAATPVLRHPRFARMIYRTTCNLSEWSYLLLLKLGLKSQDARGVLPLDTYTVVAYTYTLNEWKHILDLRYHGKTGAPHPNAKIIGEQIYAIITDRMKQYIPDFTI